MANVCMLCDKQVDGPLTAAGLCMACSDSLVADASHRSTAAPSISAPMFASPAPRHGTRPAAPARRGFGWGCYIGSVAFVLMGAGMLANALFNSAARGPVTGSGRGRALGQMLRSLFGERGEEAVLSLVFFAVATAFSVMSMRAAGARARFVGVIGLVCIGLAIPAAWFAVAQVEWREAAWQRATADALRPAIDGARESATALLPPIRDKVVVWDYTTKDPSRVQGLLPAARQGKPSDPELTFVLVVSTRDQAEKPYTDGTPAHRRTLSVAVVNWPERQVLGVYPVEGDGPPFFTSRPASDKGPVIGETDEPLKRWIVEAVPRDQQIQKELARLQGTWVAIRSQTFNAALRGPALEDPSATLRIKDRTFTRHGDQGTIFIDPSKAPKEMHLVPAKGRALWGIYELDGDTLIFCHGQPDTFERPQALQGGFTSISFVYKRQP